MGRSRQTMDNLTSQTSGNSNELDGKVHTQQGSVTIGLIGEQEVKNNQVHRLFN